MLNVALPIALGAFALAFVLTVWRLAKGPDPEDRVLALDTLYVNAVALIVIIGIAFESTIYFEAALLIALMGFVSTVAVARFLFRGDAID